MKVIVVEGLDCAGKTTYIKNVLLKKYPSARVVNYEGIGEVAEKTAHMGEALFSALKDSFLGRLEEEVLIFDRGIASTVFYERYITGENISSHFLVKVIKKMFRSLPDLECHFLDASYPVLLARLEARERDDIEELILDYIIDEHDRLDNLIGHYKAYCCYAYLMKKSDLIIVNGGD